MRKSTLKDFPFRGVMVSTGGPVKLPRFFTEEPDEMTVEVVVEKPKEIEAALSERAMDLGEEKK